MKSFLIICYEDHLTKYVFLMPLKTNCCKVSYYLLYIFV